MDDFPDQENRFNKSLVKFLNSFNYLESNIGLAISHLQYPDNPSKAYKSLATMSFDKKVKRLRELLNDRALHVENSLKEIIEFLNKLEQVKNERNRYIHGNWKLLNGQQKPVEFTASVWMRAKLGKNGLERMTLEDLEKIANSMSDTFEDYSKLREKYLF